MIMIKVSEFLIQLAATQAQRMSKAGARGRCLTMKIWRAIADAPNNWKKVTKECKLRFKDPPPPPKVNS